MLQRAMAAKARADEVGVAALHGLNLPTAGDIEEMNARLRSIAVRSERIEELLEEVLGRLEKLEGPTGRAGAKPAGAG